MLWRCPCSPSSAPPDLLAAPGGRGGARCKGVAVGTPAPSTEFATTCSVAWARRRKAGEHLGQQERPADARVLTDMAATDACWRCGRATDEQPRRCPQRPRWLESPLGAVVQPQIEQRAGRSATVRHAAADVRSVRHAGYRPAASGTAAEAAARVLVVHAPHHRDHLPGARVLRRVRLADHAHQSMTVDDRR